MNNARPTNIMDLHARRKEEVNKLRQGGNAIEYWEENSNRRKTFKVYVTDTILYHDLIGQSSLAQISDTEHTELICGGHNAERIADIMRSQPQVVILHANGTIDDDRLIHAIQNALPDTCSIVLGNSSSLIFRIRSKAAGAHHVLDRKRDLNKVATIAKSHFNKLIDANQLSEICLNNSSNRNSDKHQPHADLGKFLSIMNKSPYPLMFADQDLTIRHINPSALDIFKKLETDLPVEAGLLVGKPISLLLNEKLEAIKKTVRLPQNHHQEQIMIGIKSLKIHVLPAVTERKEYVGVIAHVLELN